ncbi:hypothetical protein [Planococcus faecalis]|uniref:Uncharacterized protein n=1 Tax=Planococcus faecalis TaxID=1598147 RepID=A0ABM6ITK8_9BACL|nr:hypothetical protein [Planococcus faecalis]AQU79707.1 hypothetical protein AJGP001_10725 [Planococcus faecalis]OHX55284.1 hypothetical protein BB777_04390 [Planococcus faecalis]
MKIGRRIYYEISTGRILVDTGEREGNVVKTTVAQDIATYNELNKRVRSTFDYIELAFGAYAQDFRLAKSYTIIPSTKKLTFNYADQPAPVAPSAPLSETVEVLSTKVETLEGENAEFMMRLAMLELAGDSNV